MAVMVEVVAVVVVGVVAFLLQMAKVICPVPLIIKVDFLIFLLLFLLRFQYSLSVVILFQFNYFHL